MDKACSSDENKKWSALDSSNPHPSFKNANVSEVAKQESKTYQISEESITIVDSADVEVTTTDTKATRIYPSSITSSYCGCNKYFYSRQ